jgi:hypothetical protein
VSVSIIIAALLVVSLALNFVLYHQATLARKVGTVAVLQRHEVMGMLGQVIAKTLTARDRRTKQKARRWLREFAEKNHLGVAA